MSTLFDKLAESLERNKGLAIIDTHYRRILEVLNVNDIARLQRLVFADDHIP